MYILEGFVVVYNLGVISNYVDNYQTWWFSEKEAADSRHWIDSLTAKYQQAVCKQV